MLTFEAILGWLVGLIARDVGVPVVEDLIVGKVSAPPSTIVDAPAQLLLNDELQDDLETQIHGGSD